MLLELLDFVQSVIRPVVRLVDEFHCFLRASGKCRDGADHGDVWRNLERRGDQL